MAREQIAKRDAGTDAQPESESPLFSGRGGTSFGHGLAEGQPMWAKDLYPLGAVAERLKAAVC